jgi:hypothetical protein
MPGFFNDALCGVTHPSYTSNEGPTARIFSRYVDVVAPGPWPCLTILMVVLLWNSLIPAMILFCSAAAVQETVQCQFVSEFARVKTANVPLFVVGITRTGHKVSRLRSKRAVCHHCAAQGRPMDLCEALRQRPRNACLLRDKSQRNLCSWCLPNSTFSWCVSHKTPLTLLHASFYCFLP